MSRIGRMPVEIPAGVDVKINGQEVTVKGPKGTLVETFHSNMVIKKEGNTWLSPDPMMKKQTVLCMA